MRVGEGQVKEGESKFELWRKRLGLPLAIGLLLLVLAMGKPETLSVAGHKSLALFAGVFVLYLTEAIPLPITSLMIIPAAVFMGIGSIKMAMSGFSSSTVFLIMGAFILGAAMVKSKLAERITFLIMKTLGDSSRNILLGVVLANIVLAFLVPSTVARTAILLPVCLGILQVFKAEGRSNFAIALLLILAFTNSTISAGILTATTPNPVTIGFIQSASGHLISFGEWFLYGFPPALIMTFFTYWYVSFIFKPEVDRVPGGAEYVNRKLAELGPINANEKWSMVVFFIVVSLWVTGGWTRIDASLACLAGVGLLFLPKYGFLTWEDANKQISWSVLLLTGGGISLGDMLVETGAAKWLALSIFHGLGLSSLSLAMVLIVVMIIVNYMHLVFVGTTPMATGLIPIVIGLAGVLNVNPVILALPVGMVIGGYPQLMFYNTMSNILVYGTGRVSVSDFPKVGFVICTVACFVYAFFAVTYWKWLGLY